MTRQPPPGMNETIAAEVEGGTPAPVSHLRGIAAAQITMGQGLVDVTRIEHEGRSGILFRPRDQHIPVGEGGELQAGEYWPVEGDVVIWIENEGGARVIQDYLVPFLPHDLSRGSQDVLAERRRQLEVEDFRVDEDDHYTSGEMAWAAVCYLQNAAVAGKMQGLGLLTASQCDERGKSLPKPEAWPWDAEWWKPAGQRRDLVKAAALIIAEIERLDRAATEGSADV